MTTAELFDKGGIVVWILLGYSLVALTVVIERFIHFALMGRPPRSLEQELASRPEPATLEATVALVPGPEGRLLRGIWQACRDGVADLERVASRIGSHELQRMERGFRTLGILGNTAPLLGLFGTITGMIKAFMVIEQAGGRVDANALAGGIWEAMLTTGVGLAVAIPVLLLLHLLEGMADRRAQSMKANASLLLERLPHIQHAAEGPVATHREGVSHAV